MNMNRAARSGAVLCTACLASGPVAPVAAQCPPGSEGIGCWTDACGPPWTQDQANLIHMSNGTFLGWPETQWAGFFAHVLDPLGCGFQDTPSSQFASIECAGQSVLYNGSALIAGGHNQTWIFASNTWTQKQNLPLDRWYPTLTATGDGRFIVFGGAGGCGAAYPSLCDPNIYNPCTDAWTNVGTELDVGQYPFAFLLHNGAYNGKIAIVGFNEFPETVPAYSNPAILDLSVPSWTLLNTTSFVSRHGSAVMYAPGKVLKCGGLDQTDQVVPFTDMIDFNVANPTWAGDIPNMPPGLERANHTLLVLADGKILAVAGESVLGALDQKEALILDPANPYQGWTTLAAMTDGRAYHSTAVLLPDATVLAAGESDALPGGEIFTPPYLLTGNPRPSIAFAPASAVHGTSFIVRVGGVPANQISKVSLVRLAAVTHGFDQNLRYVPLNDFTLINSVTLRVPLPANVNEAPPGYYMLFLISTAGVPSMAHYLQVGGDPCS